MLVLSQTVHHSSPFPLYEVELNEPGDIQSFLSYTKGNSLWFNLIGCFNQWGCPFSRCLHGNRGRDTVSFISKPWGIIKQLRKKQWWQVVLEEMGQGQFLGVSLERELVILHWWSPLL
jgi:hypothetical protein